MDWNHDEKHDWKDDAFYHNVVSEDTNKKSEKSNNFYSRGRSSSSSSGSGTVWFLVLFIVWILSKIIGG